MLCQDFRESSNGHKGAPVKIHRRFSQRFIIFQRRGFEQQLRLVDRLLNRTPVNEFPVSTFQLETKRTNRRTGYQHLEIRTSRQRAACGKLPPKRCSNCRDRIRKRRHRFRSERRRNAITTDYGTTFEGQTRSKVCVWFRIETITQLAKSPFETKTGEKVIRAQHAKETSHLLNLAFQRPLLENSHATTSSAASRPRAS